MKRRKRQFLDNFIIWRMIQIFDDNYFMRQALLEARKAKAKGEIPVGAIIACQGRVIARAHNDTETLQDVTAHAEIMAITSAAQYLGSKYLQDCTVYVTLEPCFMCAGAMAWAQIDRLVYGASDDRRGFMQYGKRVLHPRTKVEYGIMHNECSELLTSFFEARR